MSDLTLEEKMSYAKGRAAEEVAEKHFFDANQPHFPLGFSVHYPPAATGSRSGLSASVASRATWLCSMSAGIRIVIANMTSRPSSRASSAQCSGSAKN
jgi:hypothetical protein